jgi:hypothetical protein
MGSGHFDYNPNRIGYIADEVEELIASNSNDSINSWGDTVGRFYSEETIAEFRNGLHYLRLAQIYAQRIDCLVSCDDSEESFHSRLREELEQYWQNWRPSHD